MIEDEEIKSKVIEAWLIGCKKGGWQNINELRQMPFTLLTDCKGINFIEHTLAVTEGALQLARAQEKQYSKMPYKINYDRLIAGGLLHDVGKLLEIGKNNENGFIKSHSGKCMRHPISGAILAAELNLPEEIVNVIACHAKEGEGRPQVLETIFVHQADFATFNPLVMMKKDTLIK
jgi:putative nucleotidyltransferase with HDIG domain